MNDLLDAANSSNEDSPGERDDSSEERYEKLKKEEAGTAEVDPAKQRYDEIKEKAKKELMKEGEEENRAENGQKASAQELGYKEEEFEDDETDEESFITY